MIHYAIHGLVTVDVEPNVGKSVIDAIDFQLNYFRVESPAATPVPYQISIKPYTSFNPESMSPLSIFHLSKGLKGSCYHDHGIRLAIIKSEMTFEIYCETPNYLINLYIQFFLTELGYTMVHAAAASDKNGDIILFPAAGGVGKTALLGQLVTESGFKPLGDDIVLLSNKGRCHSFPRSFVLKEYHRSVYPDLFQRLNIKKNRHYKLRRFVIENAPFIGITKKILRKKNLYQKAVDSINLTSDVYAVPVEDIFGVGTVSESGNIRRVVFLERYEGTQFMLIPITEDALCRRMFAIIHHEWVDSMRQVFAIAALELVDMALYFNRTSKIIKSGIKGKSSHVLLIPEKATFAELSEEFYKLSREL